MGSFDLTYNFKDKILTPGLGRKIAVGMSLTNKKRQFVSFLAVGIKGFKFNLYSPSFRAPFINDIRQNYLPINGTGEDSLIAAKMNSGGNNLWGTYAQYMELGFILNRKFKPSCFLYVGSEEFLLHDPAFEKYEDPEHGDIDYVGMNTTFFELKLGCSLPSSNFFEEYHSVNLNIGYKWVNYGSIAFGSVPLIAYTNGSLKNKYNACGRFTLSVSVMVWSNWE